MASSNVFRSSPAHDPRRDSLLFESSSPGLPPLQDILSQRPGRPPLRNGSNAIPIPDGAPTNFIPGRSLFNPTELPGPRPEASSSVIAHPRGPDFSDSSVEVIQITKAGKSRGRKTGPKEAGGVKKPARQKAAQAKKKGKPSKAKTAADDIESGDLDAAPKPGAPKSKTTKKAITSKHFEQPAAAESESYAKLVQDDIHEPLNLEHAGTRRNDWTPPARKSVINLDTGSSALKQPPSSEADAPRVPIFKDLVHGYSCADQMPQTASAAASDEDSSFLKKRKRIELVAIQERDAAETEVKSPTKKKAPKKKARTITELATAAYRVPSQPDETPPSPSIMDHFPPKSGNGAGTGSEAAKKGKGKTNAWKRPSKASKKKAPPPKPILLSPGAALNQAARQDYVFGTSSQLAREPSPSVLRDIQVALKHSNEAEYVDITTMINSDPVEPLEQRSRLWDAAARDPEGDLFDVEVVDLIDGSPQLPMVNRQSDPFGYFGEGPGEALAEKPEVEPSDAALSFANLSDILPSPGKKAIQIDDSPYFSDSDISTSTNILAPRKEQAEPAYQPPVLSDPPQDPADVNLPLRPDFDALTDVQLAKEIKTYGFKPIKRRTAMIAMLDQCWQSKVRLGQSGIHTSATRSAATSKSAAADGSAAASNPGKKPRGRPKKSSDTASNPPPTPSPKKTSRRRNSVNASEPQEPPPSAQPPETPKRPRGRPRKDSVRSPLETSPQRKAKAKSPKKATAPSRSRGKKTANPVVEIPDSASEDGIDAVSSPGSPAEQMFSSPPPLDLSLSTDDNDNDLSLLAPLDDQQVVLFDHITKAIKSAPRSTDPANPSWYEQILLYDPLVLEDLAVWLNSGELTRVGFDTEVTPGDVKKWCESKSVCCFTKTNLRGKERKRF